MTALLAQATPPATEAATQAAASGSAEFWVFWVLAPVALGAAIAMVVVRNAVHAALLLVINFFTIALLYAVLEAQFLAVVQIIVYAGAIMVLFLFVLMLLGVDRELGGRDRIRGQKPLALLLGVLLLVGLTVGAAGPFLARTAACNLTAADAAAVCTGLASANEEGNVAGVGRLLFTRYVWPFEVTSVLLVVAALGAMVLGRKREDREPEPGQRDAVVEPEPPTPQPQDTSLAPQPQDTPLAPEQEETTVVGHETTDAGPDRGES